MPKYSAIGVLMLLALCIFTCFTVSPIPCSEVPDCQAASGNLPWLYSAYAVVGLSTLLLKEGLNLLCTFWETSRSSSNLPLTLDRRLCSSLVFSILFAQVLKNSWFATSPGTWVHTVQPVDLASEGHSSIFRPVFAIRYIEWMVTVPLMLILSGVCVLGRPINEVALPIIITEMYIFLAWAANLVQSPFLHFFLVVVTFISYGYASMGMFKWMSNFWRMAPRDLPNPEIRAAITLGLVVVFALYGLIYLLSQLDAVSVAAEHFCYTFLDSSSKVAMSFIFARLQEVDCWQALHSLAKYLGSLNTGMMSILKANFDFVVPCVADSSGWCHVQPCGSPDIKEFGRVLGRDISGLSLGELMAPEDQEYFSSYVQSTLDQARKIAQIHPHCTKFPHQAPVASVLHCNLISWGRTERDSNENATDPHVVAVVVHLSVIRHEGPKKPAHVIAAFRLAHEGCPQLPGVARGPVRMQLNTSAHAHEINKRAKQESGECTVMPFDSASNNSTFDSSNNSNLGLECSTPQEPQEVTPQTSDAHASCTNEEDSTSREPPCAPQVLPSSPSGSDIEAGHIDMETDSNTLLGGSDVGSQSSKISFVGSVTLACQQLLGPLHTNLPPKQFVPKAIEDHVQCAADMVRLKVPVEISRLHHQQQLAEWKAKQRASGLSRVLDRSAVPNDIDTHIWRSMILPALTEAPPGAKPVEPDLPDDNELWRRSWAKVFEEDEEESDDEPNQATMVHMAAWQNYPARHPRSLASTHFATSARRPL